jgi:hypothetical protein
MRSPIDGANCGTALHLSKPIVARSLTALIEPDRRSAPRLLTAPI